MVGETTGTDAAAVLALGASSGDHRFPLSAMLGVAVDRGGGFIMVRVGGANAAWRHRQPSAFR
jgi:hypothetical protein